MYFNIVTGQKGGVGKSTFSKLLVEFYIYKSWVYKLFDMDVSSLDVGKIYDPKTYKSKKKSSDENKDQNNEENFLQFTANKAYKDEVDILFETALKNNLICNLPSNIKHLFNPWMIENDLISLGRSENVKFVQWFVCSGESQSIAEFIETVDKFTNCDSFQHVFVKNYGLEENWTKVLENNKTLKETLESDSIITFDLPELSPTRYKLILDNNLTFSDAKDSSKLNIVARQGVKKFLDKAYENFEATFNELHQALPELVTSEGN